MVVGVSSPEVTGRTPRCESSITGPVPWAATKPVESEPITRERLIITTLALIQNPFLFISIYSFQNRGNKQYGLFVARGVKGQYE
jgi:hypothetical protein